MAKRPIAFISFEFEPVSEVVILSEPNPRMQTARLSLLIFRRKADGKAELSETHPLGEAHSGRDFDQLITKLKADLERTRTEGRDWFGRRRPLW